MNKTIAVTNHKGGVGKTTTAESLGAGLALRGFNTLIVDLDAQANLTESLGQSTDNEGGIYEALTGRGNLRPVEVSEHLYLIRSSRDLSAAEIELSQEVGREYVLKRTLAPFVKGYDFVIIDCPPSLGLLTINAFTAADSVIIPLQAQYLALQGLANLLEIVGKVRQIINPSLKVDAAIVTQYDNRKVLNRNVLDSVKEYFGVEVLTSVIRDNVALAEAPAAKQDIFRYAPKSAGAMDYQQLTQDLLERWGVIR